MASHIEQIKQKLDIVEYIGYDVDFKRAGRLFKACCPFHEEKTPSFIVDPEKQTWRCYGSCQEGGDLFAYVMKKQGLEFGETLRLLAERSGIELPSHYSPEETNKQKRLYDINTAAQNYYFDLLLTSPQAEKARIYLNKRQITDKSIVDFKLGYAPSDGKSLVNYLKERNFSENEMAEASLAVRHDSNSMLFDRFKDVITFPISDRNGRCVGFGVRIMDNTLLQSGHAKYVNTAQNRLFDKSNLLYALHLAAPHIRTQNQAVIMEGYFDVIAAHQAGYQNCVASMGTAVTEKQTEHIKKLTANLILALDNDKAGREAAQKSAPLENIMDGEIRILHIKDGKDPDEYLKSHAENWPALIKQAVPVIDYILEIEKQKVDLATPSGKSTLSKAMLPVIYNIKDSVRQAHYLNNLATLVSLNADALRKEMQRIDAVNKKREEGNTAESLAVKDNHTAIENYLLSLLAQHEYLIEACLAEEKYFNDTLNKAIYTKLKREYNSNFIAQLDVISSERWQSFKERPLPAGDNKAKMQDCCRRLKLRYLKEQEELKSAVLASAKAHDFQDELAHLKSLGIEEAQALKETFRQKHRR
ncbi:MAG: DNA primase [Chloroflexi bacterium]|nr:DNA primase [Chloroflexota bacterium]